jgi:hypothetical protein
MNSIRRGAARRQSSPFTGKRSARPAGKPGYFIAKERLRRFLSRHSLSATAKNHTEASMRVYKAWRNLSGPMGFQHQNQTLGWDRASSRRSAPGPGKRTSREDHAPSHRPQMSSGRLFLDRVARQHCPSPLHRRSQINMHFPGPRAKGDISTGCVYFATTDQRPGG